MDPRLENMNYWNDPRVQASMVDGGKIIEEDNKHYLVLEIEDEEGCTCPEDSDYSKCECVTVRNLKLLCKYEVCGLCDGKGRHCKPSIDAGGITESERAENWEPDEWRCYMSGGYDVTCAQCKGLRVEPVIDRETAANSKEDIKFYDDHMKAEWDHARTSAAERARGA